LHAYMGEAMPSAEAVKKLVKTISYKYHLPYFTLTPSFSICPVHGYLVGEHQYCPKCDEDNGHSDNKGDDTRVKVPIEVKPTKAESIEQVIDEDIERDLIQSIA
jgi:hypothetical protein